MEALDLEPGRFKQITQSALERVRTTLESPPLANELSQGVNKTFTPLNQPMNFRKG